MTSDKKLLEFAQIYRCPPDMAATYVKRIHERMGHEVPMDGILAAMRKIGPKRLTMDTIVERLRKLESKTVTTRAARSATDADVADEAPEHDVTPAPGSRASRRSVSGAGSKPGALTQIGHILSANWERGRRQGLRTPALTAAQFVRTAQSIAGTPRPTVARVLEAVRKLERRDVLITPNLVADEINETDEI